MTQIGAAMKAFYDAMVELEISSQVVTFTLSDFGRSNSREAQEVQSDPITPGAITTS